MKTPSIVQPDPESWLSAFHFSTQVKIRYNETDLLGHVNNVSYFMYFEQGRIEYFEHLQLTGELFGDQRVTVVARSECEYFAPIYLRDLIEMRVRVSRIGRTSLDIQYAMLVQGELKAAGQITLVLVDKSTGKSTPLPEFARERIQAFEGMAD